MLGLQRAAKTKLMLLLALLASEALVLRFLRWQAIEDAKPFDHFDLSLLASHRELVKAILFITVAMALLLSGSWATPAHGSTWQATKQRPSQWAPTCWPSACWRH